MKILKNLINLFIIIIIIFSLFYTSLIFLSGDSYNVLIRLSVIPLLFVPNILKLFNINISYPSKFIYIIFIFLGVFLGSILKLYNEIYWYDTFIHTIFGFLFSFFILEYLINSKNFNPKKLIYNCIVIISIVALMSVLWETFEFTCDNIFSKDAQKVITTGVNDTMKDIIVAVLGSMFFSLMYAYEYMYEKKLVIKTFISKIKLPSW